MKAINPSTKARATLRMIKSTVKQFQSSVIDYNDPFHLTVLDGEFQKKKKHNKNKKIKDSVTDRQVLLVGKGPSTRKMLSDSLS